MLESLWLVGEGGVGGCAYGGSESLWAALKNLPSLRSLYVDSVLKIDGEDNVDGTRDKPAGGNVHLPPTLGFYIKDTPYFLRCTSGATQPSVTTIHVDMDNTKYATAETCAGLCAFLRRCPSLAAVVLRIRGLTGFHPLTLKLPNWIQSLHIHIESSANRWDSAENETILPLLKTSPRLREVAILANTHAFARWSDAGGEGASPFSATQKYCEENGVKLHFIETNYPPLIDYPLTSDTHTITSA